MRRRIGSKIGVVRALPPGDPRSLDHPCHDEQWLELARAIGRSMARQHYARCKAERTADDKTEQPNSGDLRPLLK
jgi:hypothetical protein